MKWAQTKKAPLQGPLPNQWWAMRDVACGFAARFRFGPAALACCAGKRFAFPQLRTLSGSNPSAMGAKRKASIAGGLTNQWWAMRDVRVRLHRPLPLRACGPRVLRWKTLRVSSAPHPCGFESHALGPKKKGLNHWRPNKSMVGDEGCRVRLRRPLPLRACGPRVLRWKTLRVSSAPHPCGFESLCDGPKQKRSPFEDRFQFGGGR